MKTGGNSQSWLQWWPLALVLGATTLLYRPLLDLFWYRDDYALLYWLLHPQGPVNPADIGDFKLPIYHGLLEIHWPVVQLFGTNVTAHRTIELGLMLLAIVFVYWLSHRLSRSHLVAAGTSLLLATTPVALTLTERVSLAYQGHLVIALMAGVGLLLLQWQTTKQRSWLVGAGVLVFISLYLVGVRLHAAFLGLGALALWLSWPHRSLRREAWWFVGSITVATVAMVILGGLGRNQILITPMVVPDILGSIGNLLLPSTGTDAVFTPVESDPIGILERYHWLVGLVTLISAATVATLAGWTRWPIRLVLGLTLVLGIGFFLATPDVSQGDRTHEVETWLSWLAGGQVLLLMTTLILSWRQGWQTQLAVIGLGWAILGFLPAFLVQPGASFGTTDKYFVSSLPGLSLFWLGGLALWLERRQKIGIILAGIVILTGAWLIQTELATQRSDRAVPSRLIHRQLQEAAKYWPTTARIVLLAQPSSQAAYQLHEAFAASTIRDEAIFTVLYGLPYNSQQIRIATLPEVIDELGRKSITTDLLFVYEYSSTPPALHDRSKEARLLVTQPGNPDLIQTTLLRQLGTE